MSYLEASRLITLVASICITGGMYSQMLKLWITKSGKDFSATLVVALVINELAWFNYGLALREWPIIVLGAMNIPAVIVIAVGFHRYGRKGEDE